MSRLIPIFLLTLLALTPFASADIPRLISLQGRLTDASDNPISSSSNFAFRIYDAPTGGTPLWTEFQTLAPNSLGVFSALLGSVAALNIPFNASYWLEVQVNSEVLSPRQRMGSAGYAMRSENPWNTTGNNIYTTNAGNVGIGTASPGAKLDVQGGNIQTSGTVTASSFSGAGTGLTGTAGGLTSGSANSVPWSGVTSKPTTVAGYGITDMGSQSVNYANSAGNAPPQVHGDAAHSVAYEKTANKNVANGYAGLDINKITENGALPAPASNSFTNEPNMRDNNINTYSSGTSSWGSNDRTYTAVYNLGSEKSVTVTVDFSENDWGSWAGADSWGIAYIDISHDNINFYQLASQQITNGNGGVGSRNQVFAVAQGQYLRIRALSHSSTGSTGSWAEVRIQEVRVK